MLYSKQNSKTLAGGVDAGESFRVGKEKLNNENDKSPTAIGTAGCPPAGEAGRFVIGKKKVNNKIISVY